MAEEEAAASPSDGPLHYTGRVVRFSPPRGVGSVRSDGGREVPFDVRFLEVSGAGRGSFARNALEEGMRVGFDVGWTSRGLRVTWMRPLDGEPLEGQAGPEGEVAAEESPDQDGESRDVEQPGGGHGLGDRQNPGGEGSDSEPGDGSQ